MRPREQMNESELRFWQHAVVYGMGSYAVCMRNARHPDGRYGDAYLGRDLEFSTLDPLRAQAMDIINATRYADHWRGWYRGFAGGVTIDLVPL